MYDNVQVMQHNACSPQPGFSEDPGALQALCSESLKDDASSIVLLVLKKLEALATLDAQLYLLRHQTLQTRLNCWSRAADICNSST